MLEQSRFPIFCCEISQLHDPIAYVFPNESQANKKHPCSAQLLSVIKVNKVERIALTVRDNICVDPGS